MQQAPRRWGLEAARVLALISAVALHATWALSLIAIWDDPELTRRDWWVFVDAGRRLLDGDLAELYAARPGGFPFLHPPWVIVPSALLARLGPHAAYGAMVALELGLALVAALSLRALSRRRAGELDVVFLAVLASAPWSIALVLGQPAALPLASWLFGAWLLSKGRELPAGLALALCAIKPPLLLGPIAWLLIERRWRALAGLAIGLGAWILLSLPAGLERWGEWLAALSRVGGELDAARIVLWKQHTLLAFARSVGPAPFARVVWGLALVGLGGATLFRLRERARPLLRTLAALALATLALGPYAYFYDALLLAIPAASLWLERDRYPRVLHRAAALAAVLTFAWQHVGFFVLQRGPALGGALAAGWLCLELAAPVVDPGGTVRPAPYTES